MKTLYETINRRTLPREFARGVFYHDRRKLDAGYGTIQLVTFFDGWLGWIGGSDRLEGSAVVGRDRGKVEELADGLVFMLQGLNVEDFRWQVD